MTIALFLTAYVALGCIFARAMATRLLRNASGERADGGEGVGVRNFHNSEVSDV